MTKELKNRSAAKHSNGTLTPTGATSVVSSAQLAAFERALDGHHAHDSLLDATIADLGKVIFYLVDLLSSSSPYDDESKEISNNIALLGCTKRTLEELLNGEEGGLYV